MSFSISVNNMKMEADAVVSDRICIARCRYRVFAIKFLVKLFFKVFFFGGGG